MDMLLLTIHPYVPVRLHLMTLRRCWVHSTFLNWPLSQSSNAGDTPLRFSEQIKHIERHWKGELDRQMTMLNKDICSSSKKYVLSMFPYPSGTLHMGHMRVYTISDITAKYYRLNGYNVIHPIGWDSFGLPAENAAQERGVDPRAWTLANIATMKEQLLRTGVQFDWNREISTCEPNYFRWTQWLFCRLYERGLLRRCLAEVNWDPVDKTVLAAEQIDCNGRSWRSGAMVEKKKLRQWMIETPKYAKRLSDGLRLVPEWRDVADIQSNWIGPCDVFRFIFPLRNKDNSPLGEVLDLRIDDPVSISRTSFIILQQGHPLSDKSRIDDSPYLLSISVLNGITGDWMPIVVVPHFYDGPTMHLNARCGDYIADAVLMEQFSLKKARNIAPMTINDVQEIASFGGYGGYLTSRTLLDWVVSRQRAWGTPIPIIISSDGLTTFPVRDDQLPLMSEAIGKKVLCDKFIDGYGYYDSDTLDTFFDSSWYYLRYLDPHNSTALLSKEAAAQMPVDVYVGGVEHAAVHLFFARFISYFLTDIGVTQEEEPFHHIIPQGVVRGKTYVERETGKYIRDNQIILRGGKVFSKEGVELDVIFEKMSKSKSNGIDPLVVLEKDGVDLARLQLLHAAAPRQPINWGDCDLKGLKRWLDRIAWVVSVYVRERRKFIESEEKQIPDVKVEETLRECYNYFVRNISMCLEVLHLHNTAISRLQGFTNALRKVNPIVFGNSPEAERCVRSLITMLQVFAPYSASEFWGAMQSVPLVQHSNWSSMYISDQPWPQVDSDCDIDFILNVNGINCGRLPVPRNDIEHLTIDDLMRRASEGEHKEIIRRLHEKNFQLDKIEKVARYGFYVSLVTTLKGNVDPQEITSLLDSIYEDKKKEIRRDRKRNFAIKSG